MQPNPKDFIKAVEKRDRHRHRADLSLIEMGRELVGDYDKYLKYFMKETDKDTLIGLYEALVKYADSIIQQQEEILEIRQEAENELLLIKDQRGQVGSILNELDGN